MPSTRDYWFPAKRYGWGWGLPTRWQGWLVLIGYFALLGATLHAFAPQRHMAGFVVVVALLSLVLVGICWLKGEPPRWRWGDD
ncbi:hypothetical protein F4827_004201 [Paraburkholderia bannensis]|jgi:hypothetical protein|uniref:DUF4175 domain-containing protein n=1 Tax=Paraburkholderia bannensis TaxID=765414 RepID=A0A7W9TZN6_9BURK|nr:MULTISPECIES: hypothetical protein [Paraburkholderia]MBB3259326.1 hypothetical protein [Paraburkholderia sp. WP4_3_2]MBB6104342.1 hypothetical protein [Paraburkholderia bannensis]